MRSFWRTWTLSPAQGRPQWADGCLSSDAPQGGSEMKSQRGPRRGAQALRVVPSPEPPSGLAEREYVSWASTASSPAMGGVR